MIRPLATRFVLGVLNSVVVEPGGCPCEDAGGAFEGELPVGVAGGAPVEACVGEGGLGAGGVEGDEGVEGGGGEEGGGGGEEGAEVGGGV